MSSFKLEGDDEAPAPAPKPASGQAPAGAPAPSGAPAAEEFSWFLEDEGAAKPAAPQAAPAKSAPAPAPATGAPTPAPEAPSSARPRQTSAGAGATPATRPQTPATGAPAPANAPKAPPNLMRPAQGRPTTPRADPSQPAGLNAPAAQAVTPVLTEPDAASIAQSATPSDDFSSSIQEYGAYVSRALDAGSDFFTWVARIAVLVVGASAATLLAGVFFGHAADIAQNPKGADLIHFLILATKAFTLGTFALAASMLLLSYEDNRLGATVAGIGLLFHFAVPLGVRALLGDANPLFLPMSGQFFNVGKWLLIIGGLKALVDVAQWLWNLPAQIKAKQTLGGAVGFGNPVESKQQKVARQANMMSPCWKLPFCREPIRVLCPAFLAKQTCWKFGRGCYCDTEMVGRIVRNEPLEVIKAKDTTQSQQKPPCGRCYIYLEHQTHKFRMISPLVLPGTVVAMLAIWPLYNRLFLQFTSGYTKLFAAFSFSTNGVTPDAIKASADAQNQLAATQMSPDQIAQVSSYMIGGLLGFVLLIYMSKFVEWVIFKAKW